MSKKAKEPKSHKRVWLWIVTPFLFLAVGAGAFFGLKYYFENIANNADVEEFAETEEEKILDDEETTAEVDDYEKIHAETEEPAPSKAPLGPSPVAGNPQNANGTNSSTTYNAVVHEINGVKYVYYKTLVWGAVEADFEDFRTKVAETLSDPRGWMRTGITFVEVSDGQDLNIILSDPAHLEGYNGYCSGELSCTSGYNEVIINDVRWRTGTDVTTGAGLMNIRDYQHMVTNHEVGHWLGHYQHIDACAVNGGIAPIMLQQSTGLRNCGSFNPWPLDDELWTLR
ncbi:DUF3152 domain-containing protein [Candidatus Saccharibacteria bacterium]|nr:DUF3152 domain-containing protein [Candidatus Saccharibacteria bacterium]